MANFKLKGVRISFPNLFVPTAFDDDGDGDDDDDKKKNDKKKYNCNFLIKKTDKVQVRLIEKQLALAEKEALANPKKWAGKAPRDWKEKVFRDGDEKDEPGAFKGCWYINAKSKTKPQVVKKNDDNELDVVTDPDDVYPGCFVNVTLNFYGFIFKNKKGMAAGLGNVMFAKDGERLGAGRTDAADDFADELDEDDNDEDIDDLL